MKDFWKYTIIVILLLILGGFIFWEFKRPPSLQQDEIAIKKSTWDSIQVLANKPPVIITDTIFVKADTVVAAHKPIATIVDKTDSPIKTYNDSLIKNNIKVWTAIRVQGTLLDVHWKYVPITTQVTITKTVYVPKIVNNPVPLIKRSIYLYGIVGGNATTFIPGIGVDYVTKKNTEIGYFYQRFGTQNIHSIKLGIGLRL